MEQSTNAATETKRTDATSTAPGAALEVAEETARQLAEASLSANTRRAYLGALGRLETWLAGRELEDGAIAAYLGELFEQGRSPATASLVVAALRLRARVTGIPSPVGPATERVLGGFRRLGSDRGRGQVAGIRWESADAAAAVSANGGGAVSGLRDAALLAVMSDAMLRVSEAAALDIDDVEGEGENTLTIRCSKTDQEGEGSVLYLGARTVERVRAYLVAAAIDAGPLHPEHCSAAPPTRELRGGSQVTRSGSAPLSLSPRRARPLSSSRRRAAGSRPRCRAVTPEGSWPPGAD